MAEFPFSFEDVRPEILAMSMIQEYKMRCGDELRGTTPDQRGWVDDDRRIPTMLDLLGTLNNEVSELIDAIRDEKSTPASILKEAADVGNVARMLAECYLGEGAVVVTVMEDKE